MNLLELIDKVQDEVQDTSVATPIAVTAWLNDGQEEVSATVDVPDLRQTEDVLTVADQAWATMPSNYQRNLFFCASTEQEKEIPIKRTLQEILVIWPLLDLVFSVKMVAVEQGKIWYQGIPETVDTLKLHYYRKTTPMVADASTPDSFPSHLHERLLVPFAVAQGFRLIEQGTDGANVNFMKQMALYQLGKKELRKFVTPRIGGFSAQGY